MINYNLRQTNSISNRRGLSLKAVSKYNKCNYNKKN